MYDTESLLDLEKTIAKPLFEKTLYPYEVLPNIKDYILLLGKTLSLSEYKLVNDNIWLSKTAKIHQSSTIEGPAIIGHNTEVRPGAFIRGNVICGENCVIGNSTEIKNSILFNNVQVPHFNYIGDSVLGYKAHFGAGSITSNVKSDATLISIKIEDQIINTNLKKIGAIVGDYVEIGCNAILNPGTIIGRNSTIYPLSSIRGCVPENSILKLIQEQQVVSKKTP
ncbi:MAG: UDP-N-acetylglucosamine pyrophosphorylase [Oscillospiraceae bacterium]|nr:UDP-N-acetylglucosamine pyrophosphorylase [Oscillospiraceae bacterium]